MITIITILTVIGVAAALVAFWPHILKFLNGPLRDFAAKICGKAVEDGNWWYVNFICWLDGKLSFVRRAAKALCEKFKQLVLRSKTIYQKDESGHYVKTTVSVLKKDETTATRQTVKEEDVPYDELPAEVRKAMIAQNQDRAELDNLNVIEGRANQRLAELMV